MEFFEKRIRADFAEAEDISIAEAGRTGRGRLLCVNSCRDPQKIVVDVKSIYGETAKLAALPEYEAKTKELVGEGNEIVLTGAGPVWLYLRLAHCLHGKCLSLRYDSPATGEVVIFDHNPR